MTLLTVTEYLCGKYHGYVPVLSSLMKYHRNSNKNNTTGATSETGTPFCVSVSPKSKVLCVLFRSSLCVPFSLFYFVVVCFLI
jgi:hypothetical protein